MHNYCNKCPSTNASVLKALLFIDVILKKHNNGGNKKNNKYVFMRQTSCKRNPPPLGSGVGFKVA